MLNEDQSKAAIYVIFKITKYRKYNIPFNGSILTAVFSTDQKNITIVKNYTHKYKMSVRIYDKSQ